ncbi:OLC1v1004617C1 [Oldenlandia corymbosa var. corymbosa]|uniref:Biogenesis of lysosome-related organelles complex 1 subunit 1 n=1 Tax=Oldenlandia corymbosa var. corymbosa TaxID=529605 RepID=A0AAV1DG52_OLDCO|nr:OLC1v1004617C1 [Oldenlandia corymbosa var. corymbosa]
MDRSKATEFGGLEASLLQMINAHNQSAVQLREHTEKAKKDAITSAKRVATLLVDCVNGGVQEAFIMEKRIEMEIRLLAAAILRFGKNTDQWLAASHSINTAIKVHALATLLTLSALFFLHFFTFRGSTCS